MTVWRHHGGNALGDSWRVATWLLQQSERTGGPAMVSRHFQENRDGGPDVIRELLPRIAALLASRGWLRIVDWTGPTEPIAGADLWGPRAVYLPMRDRVNRWEGGEGEPYIATQFDGRSGGELKNPDERDLARLRRLPWPLRPVGLPMSLEESIWVIARARLFLGVCSGMSHVAHSVGVPTIVIEYRQPVGPWQPAESERFQIARGTDEAMRMVPHLMTSYQGLHAEYAKPFQPGPRPLEAWTQAEITGRFPKGST